MYQPQPANSLRLLVVEDHVDTARVFGSLLTAAGFVVTMAGSAAEALRLVGRERFDVMVSDVGLPDATGYELMKQVRERHTIRGIALSGYGLDEDFQRSQEAGFSEHLVKPVSFADLADAIRRVSEEPPALTY